MNRETVFHDQRWSVDIRKMSILKKEQSNFIQRRPSQKLCVFFCFVRMRGEMSELVIQSFSQTLLGLFVIPLNLSADLSGCCNLPSSRVQRGALLKLLIATFWVNNERWFDFDWVVGDRPKVTAYRLKLLIGTFVGVDSFIFHDTTISIVSPSKK
jgi:hypothetical protein